MANFKNEILADQRVDAFFGLESMRLRKSKTRAKFLQVTLQRRGDIIKGYLWNNSEIMASVLKERTIVKVKGVLVLYNGKPILRIANIREMSWEELDIENFSEDEMEAETRRNLEKAAGSDRKSTNTPQRRSWHHG